MKIALLGDIGLLGNYSLTNNPDLLKKLKPICDYLAKFDYVVGNLETPFSEGTEPYGAKSAYIYTDPVNVEVLKALHLDAVSLANNHVFDFGHAGFETTKRLLQEANIASFGCDGEEFEIHDGSNKILFTGYCCYSSNPLKIARTYGESGVNPLNLVEAKAHLQQKSQEGWLNIFAIHSGIEHVNTPSLEQFRAARALAEVAPFIWYGHHPHVVQGVDCVNGSVIAHSVGNFCFAGTEPTKFCPKLELTDNNRVGMILELEVEANAVKDWTPTLINIGEDGTISLRTGSTEIEQYTQAFVKAISEPGSYAAERQSQRNIFLARRKELRNISWFLKRLRPRYVRLYLDAKRNSHKFYESVTKFLGEE